MNVKVFSRMKIGFPLIISTFLLTQTLVFGQGKKQNYKPFSLWIISPDSISLDKSLRPLIDTVENAFRESYYAHLKRLESFKEFVPAEMQHDTDMKIQRAKSAEMEMLDVKYYQLIPRFTCSELNSLFNRDQTPGFSFEFVEKGDLFSYDLKKIADYYKTDYILTYKEVSTPIENGEPVLKITVQLFSRKDSKNIYNNTTYGYSRFYTDTSGKLRSCSNDLQCLLESGVASSVTELSKFLSRKQKK